MMVETIAVDLQTAAPAKCRRCRGSGLVYTEFDTECNHELIDCPACGGTGQAPRAVGR